jgi:hypothetical protein
MWPLFRVLRQNRRFILPVSPYWGTTPARHIAPASALSWLVFLRLLVCVICCSLQS